MKVPALFAAGIMTVMISGAAAQEAARQTSIKQIMSSIENVGTAIGQIGLAGRVSNVWLVHLDDLAMGENKGLFIAALAEQRGSDQVYTLRAAVGANEELLVELHKLSISSRSIVAVDVAKPGRIIVYTFGASI